MSFPGKLSTEVLEESASGPPPCDLLGGGEPTTKTEPQGSYSKILLDLTFHQSDSSPAATHIPRCLRSFIYLNRAGLGRGRLNPHQGQTLCRHVTQPQASSQTRGQGSVVTTSTRPSCLASPPNYSPSIRDASWEGLVNTASTVPPDTALPLSPRFPSTSRL